MNRYASAVFWWAPAILSLLAATGCTPTPEGMLAISAPQSTREGEAVQVTVTVRNVHPAPIIPVSLRLFVKTPLGVYFKEPSCIAERSYLEPVRAAEVRCLTSLNRIEAVQIRTGGVWRQVPDTRYQHPAHILLPGQTYTESFECRITAAHRPRLYCDFAYLRVGNEDVTRRLYERKKDADPAPATDRRVEVYAQVPASAQVATAGQPPKQFILHRNHPARTDARLISQHIDVTVKPQGFSRTQATAKARAGATGSAFLTAAGCWVFDYGEDGTWFVGQAKTTKLTGRYLPIVQALEAQKAKHLVLKAGRREGDRLYDQFKQAGYVASSPEDQQITVHIPAGELAAALQAAEGLGYTIDGTTWLQNLPTAPALPAKADPTPAPTGEMGSRQPGDNKPVE